MPGFFVSNRQIGVELTNRFPDRCVAEMLSSDKWTAKRHTLNKFMMDKTLTETDGFVLVLEGVLLNKTALLGQYHADSLADLMERMYVERGDEFFAAFRGEFAGALYDKAQDKWLVFTNHAGSNPIFYAETDKGFFAGSQVNYVLDACRISGLELHFDEQAAYQMLTYAFMADDSTYAQEIKRLRGGMYYCYQNGRGSAKTYHTFTKSQSRFKNCTEAEMIGDIDQTFRAAVKLEYDKDLEYGYEYLADLSGGLDSRMTMWVAHNMGYEPIQLLTYCKADHLDERIAKEIASYWKDALLVFPMNSADFLYDIDEITFLTNGLSLYSGITGGNHMLKTVNMDSLGLEHTGMIGDVVVGSWWKSSKDMESRRQTGQYSKKLSHRLSLSVEEHIARFGDYELYLDYTRGFQGAANTYLLRRNYTEVSSPFMNVELLQLCLDIPDEYRYDHRLYKKWIIEKYPDAAKYKWEKTGAKITEGKFFGKMRRILTRGPKKMLRILGKHHLISSGMNPLDYWISKDPELKAYMDAYAREAFAAPSVPVSHQLEQDMKELYETGNANEKTMVLTVLASMKLYFEHNYG